MTTSVVDSAAFSMLAKFWHWLTTSPYTRRLEREIERLEADNHRLRVDNDGLLKALYPTIRAIRTEAEVVGEKKAPQSEGKSWFHWSGK